MIHRPRLLWLPNRRSWPAEIERGLSSIGANVLVVLRDANTGRIKAVRTVHNMVHNAYLDGLMVGAGNLAAAATSFAATSSSTTPAAGDASIGAELAGGRATTDPGGGGGGYVNNFPDYAYRRVARRFTAAQANGSIAKLGVYSAAAGGTLWASAVLVNLSGVPTPLTKTAADTLDVVWEFRLFVQYETTSTPTIAGVPRTVVMGPVNMNANRDSMLNTGWDFTSASTWRRNLSAELPALMFTRTASTAGGTLVAQSAAAYVNGSFTRDITLPAIATTDVIHYWGLVNVGATFYSEQFRFDVALPNPTPAILVRFALARSTRRGDAYADALSVATAFQSGQHFQEYAQAISVSTAFQSGTLT